MKRFLPLLLAATVLAGFPASAQNAVPEIKYDATDPLTLPADVYLGETAGVATNSRGEIFVYTRTGHPTVSLGGARAFAHGGSRLFKFASNGRYMGEIGKDSYGMMYAQQLRIDPQDNIWVVDQMTSMVMVFDPNAQLKMLLGRKAEAIRIPVLPPGGQAGGGGGGEGGEGGAGRALPGAGAQQDVFNRPTDVAWDAAGNIFVADGIGNQRVAKFDKSGVFVKSWGSRGNGQGQFAAARAIAVDGQGNVYVADPGNKRIQVFDNNGTYKSAITAVENPDALCITPGANQFLFASNSNPPTDIEIRGEIYKMRLDGTVVGKFGHAGKLPGEFATVNAIDCRVNNQLLVGEIGSYRVQKITLK
jgi:DNA-binding beta-propeller fold protein YncE